MEKLLKKLSKQKLADVRQELSRAHLIIALLSLIIIGLLMQGSTVAIILDLKLSIICALLLTLVALTSFTMSFALAYTKSK